MTHSPLPWRAETGLSGGSDIYDANNECVCDFLDAHIAALIVHRVNTYDALVEALQAISSNYECSDLGHVDFRVNTKIVADAALALAKETPK